MASRSICSALLRTSVLSDVPHRRTTISSRSSCKRGCQRPEERRGEGRRPLRCFPVAGKRRKARARRALRGSWCEAAPPCALPSRKHANQDARAVCGVTIQPPATRSAREAPQFGARATPDHAPAKRRLLCQGRTLSFASSGLSSGASFSPLPFFPLVLLFLGGAGLSAGLPTAISPGASQERSTRLSGACPRAVRCERLSAACHTRRCRRHRRGWTGESAARHAAARCGAPNPLREGVLVSRLFLVMCLCAGRTPRRPHRAAAASPPLAIRTLCCAGSQLSCSPLPTCTHEPLRRAPRSQLPSSRVAAQQTSDDDEQAGRDPLLASLHAPHGSTRARVGCARPRSGGSR